MNAMQNAHALQGVIQGRHKIAEVLVGAALLAAEAWGANPQHAVWESTELAAVVSPRQAGAAQPGKEEVDLVSAFEFGATYKADLLHGVAGTWKKGAYVGNIDLKFTVAGEYAFKLPGSTVFFHLLNNHGGKPNVRVGSVQGIDNIEVETNTTKLLQAWYQQQLFGDKLSLLAGLYDINTEFYVTDSSGTFIHPSFGIGAELAQTGANGPSIFPTTSFGLRMRWQVTPKWYVQAAGLDGVAGDPNDAQGTQVRFDKGDGALYLFETGYSAEGGGKYAIGAWRYSSRFDDLLDVDALRRANSGVYALAERNLYRPSAERERGLNGFVRVGSAAASVNQLDFSLTLGAAYTGISARRLEDVLAFGVAAARNGSKFRRLVRLSGEADSTWEIAYELTYRAQVTPWLALQPVLEHVSFLGDSAPRAATTAGLRLEASY